MEPAVLSSTSPPRIPLSVPYLCGREDEYLHACILENAVSSVGPFVTKFERQFAEAVGAGHAVACASGTAALHLALLASGVRPGDLVLVSTLSFIASANAVCYAGAEPVLIDCAMDSWQIDPDLVERFFAEDCRLEDQSCIHRDSGRRVSALMPVHILGHAAPVARLAEIAASYKVPLVEDAAEAVGVRLDGRTVGCFGSAGCFSFNGNKTMTAGGGGMVVTNSGALADYVRLLSQQAKVPGREYIHREIGYNYRMSNLHAAVGLAQLETLDGILEKKRRIAVRYSGAFSEIGGLSWIRPMPGSESAWWLFTVALDPDVASLTPRRLMEHMDRANIETRLLWQPLHLSRPHARSGRVGGKVAERVYETALSLPSSAGLRAEEQDRVISEVHRALALSRSAGR